MRDLIELFKKTSTPRPEDSPPSIYAPGTNQVAINFDANTRQSHFVFKKSPKVIFVKNIATLEPANVYNDLPKIRLTQEEEWVRLAVVKELEANAKKRQAAQKNEEDLGFYDGMQMLLTQVLYEEGSNTLYLAAKQVPYSFLVALRNRRFPEASQLYSLPCFQTGVLAPLVSTDEKSIVLQRADFARLFSFPGGYLEADGPQQRLNGERGENFIIETAAKELREELAGIKGDKERLRFEFSPPQKIASISFRATGPLLGTIEFFVPISVNCHSSYLQAVAKDNWAQDASEHTKLHQIVPLDPRERAEFLSDLQNNKLAGESLYMPGIVALATESQGGPLPRAVPGSLVQSWPLSFFEARPMKALCPPQNDLCEEQKAENSALVLGN